MYVHGLTDGQKQANSLQGFSKILIEAVTIKQPGSQIPAHIRVSFKVGQLSGILPNSCSISNLNRNQ